MMTDKEKIEALKETIKELLKDLENAPSTSEEIKQKAPLMLENLNLWHALLLNAYESI